MNFARNEELHKQRIRLREFLEQILVGFPDEYGLPTPKDGIIQRLEIEDDMEIELDPQLFKQALNNLIKNGFEAEKLDGIVEIRCRVLQKCVFGDLAAEESAVEISVEDTGPGISEEALDKIFSPFYSTKQNGTGLGLSIAWKIVKAHGGDIRAESKLGEGSKFSILLPLRNS